MLKNNKFWAVLGTALFLGVSVGAGSVGAARTDMVDVSNHNGYMYVSDWIGMRDQYGVKAMVTKVSEGTGYHDYTAKNNISTAKQAGLYANGYHFARYQNAAQAVAEANYAAGHAQADGLEPNAVLVADVEAPQQTYVSTTSNDYNNFVFMDTVRAWGYRSDVYTMSSWLGYHMTVDAGTGWIASYPYNATGKDWYSGHHAWQWGSQYRFTGTTATGNFDVSQLYDNFYTGGQTAVKTDGAVVSIQYVPGYGVDAVNSKGKGIKDSRYTFKHGTQWHSDGIKVINGEAHYLVGPDMYIPQKYTDQAFICTVDYVWGYGVDAVNSKGEGIKDSRYTFKHGTKWRADYVKIIKDRVYYQVGDDTYLDATYTVGG